MGRITVIGSANTDLIIFADKIPVIGETIIGNEFYMMEGGKGANQAVAIKRLGGAVDFLCCVGDDLYGKNKFKSFEAEGFNLDYIKMIEKTHTGIAMITVDREAHNSIVVAPGANSKLSCFIIDSADPFSSETEYLLLQLEIPLKSVEYAIAKAKKKGIKVILNAAPAQQLGSHLLTMLDILIVNETEASILTEIELNGLQSIEKMGKKLMDKGVETVIITLGVKGTYVFTPEEQFHVPAYTVEAVDTTAAGDTFCGALTYSLCDGKSMNEAIQFASAAAAVSVTRIGAQASIPIINEVESFLENAPVFIDTSEIL